MRASFGNVHSNKLENQRETEKFLGIYDIPMLTHGNIKTSTDP